MQASPEAKLFTAHYVRLSPEWVDMVKKDIGVVTVNGKEINSEDYYPEMVTAASYALRCIVIHSDPFECIGMKLDGLVTPLEHLSEIVTPQEICIKLKSCNRINQVSSN